MSPRSSRTSHPGHVVTAVLVSHDGARWLPDCLAALAGQTRPPQRVVAVDTGSTDRSAELLEDTLGSSAVVRLSRHAALGAAVQAGLDAFQGAPAPPGTTPDPVEWVWVIHDDCAPEPTALEELLRQVADSPSVAAVGPKVVAWADPQRLVDVGRTADSSGRIYAGVEPGELDQGQHDDVRDVLALGTAGALIRRDVWDSAGGFDRAWPVFGEDIDFGWRLNARGHTVRVAPASVVRHAGALEGHRRTSDAVSGRPGALARRHQLQVVLANTSPLLVPLLTVRYFVESLLAALVALLFEHRPGNALDELLGFAGLLTHPATVIRARRQRRDRTVPHRDLRPLLAPATLRWRHAVDAVAATVGGRAAAERRVRRGPVETGPVAPEAEEMGHDDTRALLDLLRRPGVALFVALTVIALIADRGILATTLQGGRLLPAPAGASDLWHLYTAGWHPVGLGSTVAAPPSIALLAAWSTLWLGNAPLAIAVLVLGAVPLAGLTAYLATGGVDVRRELRAWAAAIYAVVPALTGAVAGGRVDAIAATILLPWCIRSVVRAVLARPARWDRWFRAGILLAVVTAFAPVLWPALLLITVAAAVVVHRDWRRSAASVLVTFGVPLLLLLPWTASLVVHPHLLVAGSGLPDAFALSRPLGVGDVLLGDPAGPATPPAWLLAPFMVAALVALLRSRGQRLGTLGVGIAVVGMATALVVSRLSGAAAANPAVRYWTGPAGALVAAGALLAALVGVVAARESLRRHSFGWRQPAAVVLVGAAVLATGVMLVGWAVRGAADPLTTDTPTVLPPFAAAEMVKSTAPRVLVLRVDGDTVEYAVIRTSDGLRLGDADVADASPGAAGTSLSDAIQRLAAGESTAAAQLAEFGVGLIVVPGEPPAELDKLGSVTGLTRVPTAGAVVWRLDDPVGELTVTQPPISAVDRPRPAGADVTAIHASGATATTELEPGPEGRLLVLAEPADAHWRATLDGAVLPPTTAYGWAQAWQLPADGGQLVVARVGDSRASWMWVELFATIAVLLLAVPARTRAGAGAETDAEVPA